MAPWYRELELSTQNHLSRSCSTVQRTPFSIPKPEPSSVSEPQMASSAKLDKFSAASSPSPGPPQCQKPRLGRLGRGASQSTQIIGLNIPGNPLQNAWTRRACLKRKVRMARWLRGRANVPAGMPRVDRSWWRSEWQRRS